MGMQRSPWKLRLSLVVLGLALAGIWTWAKAQAGDSAQAGLPAGQAPALWQQVAVTPIEATDDLLERGDLLYAGRCAICHGKTGEGNGPAAQFMQTPPRDFSRSTFKFRNTTSESLPTDADLFRTVTVGFPAYGMPSYRYLSEEDRWAVVHYLKTLIPDFADPEIPVEAVDIGNPPEKTPELMQKGREVFAKARCGQCHGQDGAGFGPSGATLTDSWGNKMLPFDLTSHPVYYKSGFRVQDIMRSLSTGLSGTPMPSYMEAGFTLEELWALSYYVASLISQHDANQKRD